MRNHCNKQSRERVDALIHLSDQVYPILEQNLGKEIRARRILRLGITTVAISLSGGLSLSSAGKNFDDLLTYELKDIDFGKFVTRGDYARQLHPPSEIVVPPDLARLANRYSDVRRETMLADSSLEPDSIHALHLSSWSVPYAQMHYPDLDPGKVALYSLIHDLPEAYAGDVGTFEITPEQLAMKAKNETKAIHYMERIYGAKWPGLLNALERYETLCDDESKFVKSADKNDPGFTHQANNAKSLRMKYNVTNRRQFYASAKKFETRMAPYVANYPLIIDDRRELNRRIAQSFDK